MSAPFRSGSLMQDVWRFHLVWSAHSREHACCSTEGLVNEKLKAILSLTPQTHAEDSFLSAIGENLPVTFR